MPDFKASAGFTITFLKAQATSTLKSLTSPLKLKGVIRANKTWPYPRNHEPRCLEDRTGPIFFKHVDIYCLSLSTNVVFKQYNW